MTDEQFQTLIDEIIDPEFERSLKSLGMVKSATVSGTEVHAVIDLPTPAYPNPQRIGDEINRRVREADSTLTEVKVEYISNLRGKNSGGKVGLRVKNVIAVGSGKGGVGKSTIAAALAYGLKECGCVVGLMDADVYGPSIPHMLGIAGQPMVNEYEGPDGQKFQKMAPLDADGIEVMSMAFFVGPDQAVVWRGPMLHKALTQFLQQTDWGDLDYLIIDLPPGTGDVALTLSQMLGLAGAVVVCTPQQVALLDAVKAINMYEQVKVPTLGIVENMSGDIFGSGGAREKADELGVPFLGEVPIESQIRIQGDAGKISELFAEGNPAREPLMHVSQRVAIEIARQLLDAPTLPELEIL